MIEIREILRAVRQNLDLDVAFVSQFVGDQRVFRLVDAADPGRAPIREGEGGPLAGSYCELVADGRLPNLIADTGQVELARRLPVTRSVPVGAHVGVPIRLSDGTVFGTFCCFGHTPAPALNGRDLAMLRTFADVTARRLERDMLPGRLRAAKEERVRTLIASGGPAIVYQPVFLLDTMSITGAEALSRFPGHPGGPAAVFAEAAAVGLQVDLELVAIRNALRDFSRIWQKRPIPLGLNASASTIVDERLWDVLEGYRRDLLVIELTEHEEVHDYAALVAATRRLRSGGTRIAIDDVGAGYASMRHVLKIRPDVLKLDVGLIRSIDDDEMKLALTSSLKHFADRFACRVVAEGVETAQELSVLRRLGLQAAQGFLLGRPVPCDALLARLGPPRPAGVRRPRPAGPASHAALPA